MWKNSWTNGGARLSTTAVRTFISTNAYYYIYLFLPFLLLHSPTIMTSSSRRSLSEGAVEGTTLPSPPISYFFNKNIAPPFRSFKSMLADRLATANLSATTISPRTLTRYLPISIASTSLRPIFGPKGIRLRCFLPCVYNLPNAGEIRTAELLD